MDQAVARGLAVFCGFPLLIWLIVTMFLVFQANMPTCSVQGLYIPALNTRLLDFNASTATTTFIFFDAELKNVMEEIIVRYKYIHLTFHCGRRTGFAIANYTVPGFYQGHKKRAHLRDVVETRGMPWRDAFAAVSNCSTAAFTVELATSVKLKREIGYAGEKELFLRGDVEVNGYGEMVRKKAIKLIRKKIQEAPSLVDARGVNLQLFGSDKFNIYPA